MRFVPRAKILERLPISLFSAFVLDPVDGWKGLRVVWFGSGCRVMHRRPTARL
jgi:hypothetical protein